MKTKRGHGGRCRGSIANGVLKRPVDVQERPSFKSTLTAIYSLKKIRLADFPVSPFEQLGSV